MTESTLTADAAPWPGVTIRTRVRVAGVDKPEIRSMCQAEKNLAVRARDFVRSVVGAGLWWSCKKACFSDRGGGR